MAAEAKRQKVEAAEWKRIEEKAGNQASNGRCDRQFATTCLGQDAQHQRS